MKIWRLEYSHSGDPLYNWAFFKNKPDYKTLANEFKEYRTEPVPEDVLEQLINIGRVIFKYDDFYLEEVEGIENDE